MEPNQLEKHWQTLGTREKAAQKRRLRRSCLLLAAWLAAALPACSGGSFEAPQGATSEDQGQRRSSAPTLLAPADGATLTETRPLLSWQSEQSGAQVIIELCADAACTVGKQSFTASSGTGARPEKELAPGMYYWRVARIQGMDLLSEWSVSRSFLIAAAPPIVVTKDLFGVWSVSASDVWVVGAAGTVLHYNGNWSAEASSTTQTLYSVWATSGGQAWAVGAAGTILRRNGTKWTAVANPAPETTNLWGVWASGDGNAWAAGDGGLILHWDGVRWTVAHDRMAGSLRAVWGNGADDVWVVGGGKEPDGDYAALLLHWDGTRWTESYVCNPEGTRHASGGWIAGLTDVWGTHGGTTWAAGQCQSGASFIPYGYVAQNDGTSWRDTPDFGFGLPNGKFRPLRTIWSSGAGDVWAASASETVGGAPTPPTMLHFDGSGWTASSQAITVGINDLGGTAASDVWAVGKAGKRLHYDGKVWTPSP